jgi:hypothetical protein
MHRAVLILGVAGVFVGCAAPASYTQLAEAEQRQFARCWRQVGAGPCGPLSLAHQVCRHDHQEQYASLEPGARGEYLQELGCGMPASEAPEPECSEPSCPECPDCPECLPETVPPAPETDSAPPAGASDEVGASAGAEAPPAASEEPVEADAPEDADAAAD